MKSNEYAKTRFRKNEMNEKYPKHCVMLWPSRGAPLLPWHGKYGKVEHVTRHGHATGPLTKSCSVPRMGRGGEGARRRGGEGVRERGRTDGKREMSRKGDRETFRRARGAGAARELHETFLSW